MSRSEDDTKELPLPRHLRALRRDRRPLRGWYVTKMTSDVEVGQGACDDAQGPTAMKFWKPKGEPVEVKMLPESPALDHYFRLREEPYIPFTLCRPAQCVICTLIAETKYEQHTLDRWADDGGRCSV